MSSNCKPLQQPYHCQVPMPFIRLVLRQGVERSMPINMTGSCSGFSLSASVLIAILNHSRVTKFTLFLEQNLFSPKTITNHSRNFIFSYGNPVTFTYDGTRPQSWYFKPRFLQRGKSGYFQFKTFTHVMGEKCTVR